MSSMSSLSKSSSLSSSSSETFSVVCVTSCGERLPFVALPRGSTEEECPPLVESPAAPVPGPLLMGVLSSTLEEFAWTNILALPPPPTARAPTAVLVVVPRYAVPGVCVAGEPVGLLEAFDDGQGDDTSLPMVCCCCCCSIDEWMTLSCTPFCAVATGATLGAAAESQ
jgi:hypothetical protein